jgi:hypothetical protein
VQQTYADGTTVKREIPTMDGVPLLHSFHIQQENKPTLMQDIDLLPCSLAIIQDIQKQQQFHWFLSEYFLTQDRIIHLYMQTHYHQEPHQE